MSTFARNTNTSRGNTFTANKLAINRNVLAVNKNSTNVNSNNLVKRNALSQTTNLINKNNNKLTNIKKEKLEKDYVKVSATENASNDVKTKTKLVTTKSKIPKFDPVKTTNAVVKKEPQLSFSSFIIPSNVEDIDANDINNVLLTPDFSNDIYVYLRYLENKSKLKTNFLEIQLQMNAKMRARLVDWIIAVHYKFRLVPETLYMTIALMDRFFEKEKVNKEKIQLVGLTAFFIACKYEEIYPPEITDFVKICDNYTKKEILKMEIVVLKTLSFDLSKPLPLHFLRRFSKAAQADQMIHTMAKYLMELSLIEYECASWKPSLLAASALYLTLQILSSNQEQNSQWTNTLAFYTGYTEDDLLPFVAKLCRVIINSKNHKLQSCRSKYSTFKLMNISSSPKLECDYVVKMSEKFI